MATTPEGKIKRKVSALLAAAAPRVYYEMPVPGGFGKTTLDYLGCANGMFFAVETKAPGGKPTERQKATMAQMRAAGAEVFLIDGGEGVEQLRLFLETAGVYDVDEEGTAL
jgi:hypothetical protein